jgi:ring-1,2-phenylacetyl-CoA epoxidase subunit PaaD
MSATPLPIQQATILRVLETVHDPEVPVLSVIDLGVLREISRVEDVSGDPYWRIRITPTYVGCPAMDMIVVQMRMALFAANITRFTIETVLAPPWTTEWISETGKAKLKAYGIAPPKAMRTAQTAVRFGPDPLVPCPHCGADETKMLSAFGSTACKALYQCGVCKEPFDYFKCH